jgi:hypothetical protein
MSSCCSSLPLSYRFGARVASPLFFTCRAILRRGHLKFKII